MGNLKVSRIFALISQSLGKSMSNLLLGLTYQWDVIADDCTFWNVMGKFATGITVITTEVDYKVT